MWLFIFFSFFLRQVPIPNKGTTYWCQMFKIPAFQEKHHVIKVCDFHVGKISLMWMKKKNFLNWKIVKKNIEMISKYMEVSEKEETILSDPHTVFRYWKFGLQLVFQVSSSFTHLK